MQQFERKFSTGSIEAPDPNDKHLDALGYYRKHTARDATCLFRVISEQMYNAQIHHHDIRDICVRYMAMHQSTYEKKIPPDTTFDDYLTKMSKIRTHGSIAELHALAYRFKRNVILFEAYSSEKWFVYEEHFEDCFLVFYTPPRHFDSVFRKAYIESVAFCQSLTYEILYSHVFKLPDVVYAVERMLHDPEEGTHVSQIEVSPYDESHEALTLTDGRYFVLDHPDETECILKNYLFCNFHNKQFEKIMAHLQEEFYANHQNDPEACANTEHIFGPLLLRKHVSCVRQLLDENIKPFSYKVAKALDNHIYRNIEFDVWNDHRKYKPFNQWNQGDSLQVGVKCIVDTIDPDKKSPYHCHIQEMRQEENSCVVFVEALGEHRIVLLKDIRTMPSVSWMIPNYQSGYRTEKKRKRNWHSHEQCKSSNKQPYKIKSEFQDIDYFTKPMHVPQQYCEIIVNPMYGSRFSKNDETGGNNQTNNKNVQTKKTNTAAAEKPMKTENAKNASAKRPTAETKSTKTDLVNAEFEPHIHYGNQPNMGYTNVDANVVTYAHMERADIESSTLPHNYGAHNHSMSLQSMIKNKAWLQSMYPINLNAPPSWNIDCSDLQRIDAPTLRFFYNLGHEYLRFMNYRFPPKAVTAMLQGVLNEGFPARPNRYSGYYDSFDIGELSNDFNRCTTFTNQAVNKPNENTYQYRRSFNANTVNAPKKNTKSYRSDFNKKRQFGDPESSKHQQQNYNKTTSDYSEGAPTTDANPRSEGETVPTLMATPHHLYTYPPGDNGDGNMYGVFGYGMYPHVNDNFSPYPLPVPGGMIFSETAEGDLTQTYPYYNPPGAYYYSAPPMPPFQMGQHQGAWYPQPMMQLPVPTQNPGTTMPVSAAPSVSTPPYGGYGASETETSAPFTPNEP